MDNRTFIDLLDSVPRTRLKLLELAGDVVGPDGGPDLGAAISLSEDLEPAADEARTYAATTARLVRGITWMLKPHRY